MDKERVKQLIKGLKAALGKDEYADFKATSVRFQTGTLEASAYYESASRLLRQCHPHLLLETMETLPDKGKRAAVLELHAAAGANSSGEGREGRGPVPRPRAPPGYGGDGAPGGKGAASTTMDYTTPLPAPRSIARVPTTSSRDGGGGVGAGGEGGFGGGFHQAEGSRGFAFNKSGGGGGGGGAVGNAREPKAEVLAPGLVCLRRAVDFETQAWLAAAAFEVGESSDFSPPEEKEEATSDASSRKKMGFYENVPGDRPGEASVLRLNQGTRGRVILGMEEFPDRLRQLCLDCVGEAQRADPAHVPSMNPTTVLVNFYKEGAQFKWHRDSEDPALARSNRAPPIVSFTVVGGRGDGGREQRGRGAGAGGCTVALHNLSDSSSRRSRRGGPHHRREATEPDAFCAFRRVFALRVRRVLINPVTRALRCPVDGRYSAGLSADFAYKRHFEDERHETVRLNSGDVLLFGGPSRMIVHSVTRVIPKTMPGVMRGRMLHGRLNITVRDIGRGVIDTSMFPAYRVTYDDVASSDQL